MAHLGRLKYCLIPQYYATERGSFYFKNEVPVLPV